MDGWIGGMGGNQMISEGKGRGERRGNEKMRTDELISDELILSLSNRS